MSDFHFMTARVKNTLHRQYILYMYIFRHVECIRVDTLKHRIR